MSVRAYLFGLVFATLLSADTLVLKSGDTLEGDYFGATPDEIRFIVDGQLYQVVISEVAVIRLRTARPAAECPPCPDIAETISEPRVASSASSESERAVSRQPDDNAAVVTGLWLDAGTRLTARLLDDIKVRRAKPGSTYHAVVDEAVEVDGQAIVPKGAELLLRLEDQRHVSGGEGLRIVGLRAIEIIYRGRGAAIQTAKGVLKGRDTQSKVTEGIARTGAKLGRILVGGMGGGQASDTAEETIDDKFGDDTHLLPDTILQFTLTKSVEVPWPAK